MLWVIGVCVLGDKVVTIITLNSYPAKFQKYLKTFR